MTDMTTENPKPEPLSDEQIAAEADRTTYSDAKKDPVAVLLYLLKHEDDGPIRAGLTWSIRELQQRRAAPEPQGQGRLLAAELRGFLIGAVFAAWWLHHAHGEDTYAADLLCETMSASTARRLARKEDYQFKRGFWTQSRFSRGAE